MFEWFFRRKKTEEVKIVESTAEVVEWPKGKLPPIEELPANVREELQRLAESLNPRSVVRDLGMQSQTVIEAVEILKEASPALGMYLDRFGYRTMGQGLRDISETARLSILRRAEWLSQSNPLASRSLQIRTDLIVSEGFEFKPLTTETKYADQLRKVLDTHWEINEWQSRLFARVHDIGVTGEMIRMLPPLEAQALQGETLRQGYFRAGMVLPHNVQALVPNPWDAERLHKMRVNVPDSDGKGWRLREYDIVSRQVTGRFAGTLTGQVFYYGANRRPGASRGVSDLLPAMEWIDIHDQLQFAEAERTRNLLKFLWDVEIKGATANRIAERMAEIKRTPPDNGTIFVHNENEQWRVITPSFSGGSSLALINEVFKTAWGGLALPEHWFVSANTVSKACHAEDTETLTKTGWKGLDALSVRDELATMNPDTGELEYHKPNRMFVYDHDGPMVHFDNKDVDCLVTPNHVMWAKRARNNPEKQCYEKILAEDTLKGNRFYLPLSAEWSGGVDEDFTLPEVQSGNGRAVYPAITVPGDLWAEFLGYIVSEGHIRDRGKHKQKNWRIVLSQKKPCGVVKIRECIDRLRALGFRWCEYEHGQTAEAFVWTINDKALNLWLSEHCGMGAKTKKLPEMVWNYTARRMGILLDALVEGDGSRGRRSETNRRGCTYYTSSPQLIDDVQRLCCHVGMSSKTRSSTRAVAIQILDHKEVSIGRKVVAGAEMKSGIKSVDNYRGRVYCFDVKNHLFITRRNGKVCISHNSAVEMSEPIWAWARTRKEGIREFLVLELEFAVQVAQVAGIMDVPLDHRKVEVTSRDPDRTAYDVASVAINNMADALGKAMNTGLITHDDAVKVFRHVVEQNGIKLDKTAENSAELAEVHAMSMEALRSQAANLKKIPVEFQPETTTTEKNPEE